MLRWLLPFSLAVIVGIVLWLPAAWLHPTLMPQLSCEVIRGSIWHGQCERAAWRDAGMRPASYVGSVQWHLAAHSLLILQPQFELQIERGQSRASGTIRYSPSARWQLKNVSINADYATLAEFWPPLRQILSLGRTSRAMARIVINNAVIRAARIEALEATVEFELFGTHVLSVYSDGSGQLATRNGMLRLDGQLRWQPDGSYRLPVLVAAGPQAPSILVTALRSLGTTDAGGRYDLTLEGSLSNPRP
jgi:hypothetical protein